MDGLPTTFASCAGSAKSVKRAAYNCLRDWKPAMETYPGKVVYHFSPSITAAEKRAIREAAEFALVRAEGYVAALGYAPEFHVFYNMDDASECRKLLKSWPGTANIVWIYQQGGMCASDGFGGNGIGSSIPGTTSAGISTPRNHEVYSDWVFPFYTYQVLPHEIVSAFPDGRLFPHWVWYAASRAAWQAAGIQILGDDLGAYHRGLLPEAGKATWQPTVKDPRFGPGPALDWETLSDEIPWQYAVMDLGSQYVTAMFGPDWIQKVLYPVMLAESNSNPNATFRAAADRVANQVWGGEWNDLESAVDTYVLDEFRKAGITGLE